MSRVFNLPISSNESVTADMAPHLSGKAFAHYGVVTTVTVVGGDVVDWTVDEREPRPGELVRLVEKIDESPSNYRRRMYGPKWFTYVNYGLATAGVDIHWLPCTSRGFIGGGKYRGDVEFWAAPEYREVLRGEHALQKLARRVPDAVK